MASWDLSSPSTTDPYGTDALALSEPVSWPGETSEGDVLRISLVKSNGLLRCLSGKESTCQGGRCRRCGFSPWVGEIPWRKEWLPTPGFLPGESHGQRSLAGCSPGGHKESDMTERLKSSSTSTPQDTTLSLSGAFAPQLHGPPHPRNACLDLW